MKKYMLVLILVLAISISTTLVLARNFPAITAANKLSYKTMLQNYFRNVNYGYGIGLNGNNYLVARWQIENVRTLNMSEIKNIVASSNATNWEQLRQDVQTALNQAVYTQEGRIKIGNTTYVMANIQVTNQSLAADIKQLPVYSTCAQQNISAADCESNAQKVGDISITMANAIEGSSDPRVWSGTLDFNSVAYTFVSFVYPR